MSSIHSLQHHVGETSLSDDTSTSSTIPAPKGCCVVEEEMKVDECSSSSSKNKTAKTVSFDFGGNVEHEPRSGMWKADLAALWYSHYELRMFKNSTFSLARQVARSERHSVAPFSYQRVMEHVYGICCSHSNSQQKQQQQQQPTEVHDGDGGAAMASSYSASSSLLNATESKNMARWAEVAPSRLGLEKWTVDTYAKDRLKRRRKLMNIVRISNDSKYPNKYDVDDDTDSESDSSVDDNAQSHYRSSNSKRAVRDGLDVIMSCTDDVNGEDGVGCSDEIIRHNCEIISQPCRLFAQCIATAQAAALEKEMFFSAF